MPLHLEESVVVDDAGVKVTMAEIAGGGAVAGAAISGTTGTFTGAVTSTSSIKSSGTLGIGYGTGAGGAVTQITNRSTGVTLSKIVGKVTTDTTSLAAGAAATFTVTNTLVAATDVIVLNITGATTSATRVNVTAVAAGSFDITMMNNHASTAEVAASVINFAVIKGVAA